MDPIMGVMQNTRKLQIAAELIEDVAEDTDDHYDEAQLNQLALEVDEMRQPLFQQRLKRRYEGGEKEGPREPPQPQADQPQS